MTYNVFSGTLNPTHFTSLSSSIEWVLPLMIHSEYIHVGVAYAWPIMDKLHVGPQNRKYITYCIVVRRGPSDGQLTRTKNFGEV